MADISSNRYDQDDQIPVSPQEAAQREATRWAMTHSLAGGQRDDAASAELAASLPGPGEPVTAESVDATLVTTSLRIPLGTQRRVQAYAEAHDIKPTALMRQWIEQMLAAVEHDHPISLQDAIRALAQLTPNEQQAA